MYLYNTLRQRVVCMYMINWDSDSSGAQVKPRAYEFYK